MNIQIFGTKKCNDTKKAERFFKERGIKFQFIDMKEKGMSKGEFNSVAQANGGLENMINWEGKDKDLLACTLEVDEAEVLKAVSLYTNALMLLDQYDHQSLKKPTGSKAIYRITYEDCRNMVNAMEDSFHSDVFGIEKEKGKVEGILAAVYQNVFGGDVYPSLEEKAANLLYFMIKDHPYADGCKRIAASLFLEFLARNNILYKADQKRVSDGALVAITLMIAESDPKEKDIMVNLVMNLLIM